MKIMKITKTKKFIMTMLSAVIISALSISFTIPSMAAEAGMKTYKVSFKAGSRGTFTGGAKSMNADVTYNGIVNVDAYLSLITPENGYYPTGWSPDVSGNQKITEKTNYVAQYRRIINEAVYRVNYIDNYGNAVATQKVVTTQKGINVTEAAEPVDGFLPDAQTKSAVVADKGTEITFVYTSTAEPNIITETETVVVPGGTTTVTQTTPGAAAPAAPAATPAAPAAAPEETVTAPDEGVPQAEQPEDNENDEGDTVTAEDEDVPLSESPEGSSHTALYIGIGVALLAALGAGLYFGLKRKRL